MGRGTAAVGIGISILFFSQTAPAEDWIPDPVTGGPAWIDDTASRIADFGADLHVELALSQAVPWRAFTLDAPRRLVLDFGEVDFAASALMDLVDSDGVEEVRMGPFRTGWSRLVLTLAQPMRIETAGMRRTASSGGAVLKLQLAPIDERDFEAATGAPESAYFALPAPVERAIAPPAPGKEQPLRVMLDPGHGGLDPGAQAGSLVESHLMLDFARTLSHTLTEAGMEVALTRSDDSFVPLARRVAMAEAHSADLFLSLHADARPGKTLSGTTIYTLSAEATDAASERLAAGHDRADLLAGIDLAQSAALPALFEASETVGPRSEHLADALVVGLARTTGDLHQRPRLRAAFSVLTARDIPSVLVELGFLSNPEDRARLSDAAWRAHAATGIRDAIVEWAAADATVAWIAADDGAAGPIR